MTDKQLDVIIRLIADLVRSSGSVEEAAKKNRSPFIKKRLLTVQDWREKSRLANIV